MSTAYGYLRCSGRSQLDGDTWQRQDDAIVSCAGQKCLTLDRSFREEAVPGKTEEDHRPAFQEMVAAMLREGVKVVIVESLDRLARGYAIQEQLITYLASKGLTLIAANTGEDITAAMMGDPMKRALVQMQAVFAELDKNLIVAKLRKARERKRSNFGRAEGRKPFGYMSGGSRSADIPNPAEYPVLKVIHDMQAEGLSAEIIASRLNLLLLNSRTGKPWRASVIRKILSRNRISPCCPNQESKLLSI